MDEQELEAGLLGPKQAGWVLAGPGLQGAQAGVQGPVEGPQVPVGRGGAARGEASGAGRA